MQINLRRKWRRLVGFGALWAFILFPIPFLPAFGSSITPQAFQALIIITAVVSVPLILLFIFMK
jgi:hypothetical protein